MTFFGVAGLIVTMIVGSAIHPYVGLVATVIYALGVDTWRRRRREQHRRLWEQMGAPAHLATFSSSSDKLRDAFVRRGFPLSGLHSQARAAFAASGMTNADEWLARIVPTDDHAVSLFEIDATRHSDGTVHRWTHHHVTYEDWSEFPHDDYDRTGTGWLSISSQGAVQALLPPSGFLMRSPIVAWGFGTPDQPDPNGKIWVILGTCYTAVCLTLQNTSDAGMASFLRADGAHRRFDTQWNWSMA